MIFEEARKSMVENQIRKNGITNMKVLGAMQRVPRHEFVNTQYRDEAYDDYPLPIGFGQTISQPLMVALMTELLELTGKEKVLEVGTGSGYQTAVLAEIAKKVISIEINPELVVEAKKRLKKYKNVEVIEGNGQMGDENFAPYDRIIVTAAADRIPNRLAEQLKQGGIMIIPIGDKYTQQLEQITKTSRGLKHSKIGEVRFVPLVND